MEKKKIQKSPFQFSWVKKGPVPSHSLSIEKKHTLPPSQNWKLKKDRPASSYYYRKLQIHLALYLNLKNPPTIYPHCGNVF